MKMKTERATAISYAVRQTIPRICAELGISPDELAMLIGHTGRQSLYKMKQAQPDARPTASVVALLALYERMSYGDRNLAKRIAGILNAEIRNPRHKFSGSGANPFLSNWWGCFEPAAEIDLHDFDAVCQNYSVILDPNLAASADFETEFQPLADALMRAQKYALVPQALYLDVEEQADREENPGVVCGWVTDISYQAALDRLDGLFRRELLKRVSLRGDSNKGEQAFLREMNALARHARIVLVTDDPDRAKEVIGLNRKRRRSDRCAQPIRILGVESTPKDDGHEAHPIDDHYSEWTRKTLRADEPAEYGSAEWRERLIENYREEDELFRT